MRKLVFGSFFAIAALLANEGQAEEFAAAGFGTLTCAEFAKLYAASPEKTENMFYTWALGFMSGINIGRNDNLYRVLNASSEKEDFGAMRDYCDAHPLKTYVYAVISVYNSMPGKPMPDAKNSN